MASSRSCLIGDTPGISIGEFLVDSFTSVNESNGSILGILVRYCSEGTLVLSCEGSLAFLLESSTEEIEMLSESSVSSSVFASLSFVSLLSLIGDTVGLRKGSAINED